MPSITALAMSDTSARVGVTLRRMLPSISLAVRTNFAWSLQRWMISFVIMGT